MASDDFEVVAFKILSYLYRCMKVGKKVDIAALRQLVGCNEAYFGAVVRSLQSKGYVEGFAFDSLSESVKLRSCCRKMGAKTRKSTVRGR